MNELALFAGGGGGILGGHLLGWKTVCAVEIEKYPRGILLERQRNGILPRFPIWDDIKTFDGRPWKGRVDIISGGFPCQDISYAGKRAGIDGEKSGLWKEMRRMVREVGPKFVLVENSPGLLSPIRKHGRWVGPPGITTVFQDLAKMGYYARWCVLGADDAGAPHQRKRIWILAYTDTSGLKVGGQFQYVPSPDKRQFKCSSKIAWWDIDPADLPDTGCTYRPGNSKDMEKEKTERSLCELHDQSSSERLGNKKIPDSSKKRLQNGTKETVTEGECTEELERLLRDRGKWPTKSRVGRVAHGIPHRVDRLKAPGNAQVPAVAALAFVILSEGLI